MKNKIFWLGFALILLTSWPLWHHGFFTHHDDVQFIRLYEMDKCVRDFQIPCRWVPDLGGGYGYPLFNYYAPLPYYVGEIFYLITGNLILSVKLLFLATILGAYTTMFLLGEEFSRGRKAAFLSAVLYSFIPYKAVNLFVRGAMGELWGMVLSPLVLFSFLRLIKNNNKQNFIFFGVSLALLIMSHNLTVVMLIPFLGIWYLFKIVKEKRYHTIPPFFIGTILALLISSFYILPVIAERKLVHVESTTVGYFSYTEHFKGLSKTILNLKWNWGPSIREVPGGERDADWYSVGLVHLLLAGAALFILIRKKDKQILEWLMLFGLFFLSLFLIHPKSLFIWEILNPFFKYLQFPWRFLLVASFLLSLLGGYLGKYLNWKTLVLITILVISFNFRYFRPEKFIDLNNENIFSLENWDKQIKRSIFDYLPIYATLPPREMRSGDYQLLGGDLSITNFKQGSDWFRGDVWAGKDSKIRLSQYYFPNWKVKLDNKEIETSHQPDYGLMEINVPKGQHVLNARLYNTWPRLIGNALSLITIILTLIYLLIFWKR